MASGKRQPNKQKRTQQNRQERAARQARAANASMPAPEPKRSSKAARSGSSSPAATPVPEKTSLLGRLRTGPSSATASSSRAASRPAPSSRTGGAGRAGAGGAAAAASGDPLTDRRGQPVGYRAALTALLASIAAVVASFFVRQAVDDHGTVYTTPRVVAEWAKSALHSSQAHPTSDAAAVLKSVTGHWMPHREAQRLFLTYFPWTIAVVLPIGAAYLLFTVIRDRRGAKTANRAMYGVLLGSVVCFPLLQFFLPTVIAAWVAGYQVRRAEMVAIRLAGADGGDVIEADVVDADVIEADDDEG